MMNPQKFNALLLLLDDNDPEVRLQVEQELLKEGDKILPFLKNAKRNSDYTYLTPLLQALIERIQNNNLIAELREWHQHEQQDLLRAFWILNKIVEPELDYDYFILHIDKLAQTVAQTVTPALPMQELLRRLNYVFFETLAFKPDIDTFHSPENSFLLSVIERRKGNPISLSILYMILGRKIGLPLYGVNLPNIFVLTYLDPHQQFFINPFNYGSIFQKSDIEEYIRTLKLPMLDIFHQPCDHVQIIQRVLRNLISAFEQEGQNATVERLQTLLELLDEEN
jgi:regulator of sirC expression with transglutaminase-like and TPR domain